MAPKARRTRSHLGLIQVTTEFIIQTIKLLRMKNVNNNKVQKKWVNTEIWSLQLGYDFYIVLSLLLVHSQIPNLPCQLPPFSVDQRYTGEI